MYRPRLFLVIVWIAMGIHTAPVPASEPQTEPELETLRKQISISERKRAYFALMSRGDAGYRIICDLIGDGSIEFPQLIDWEYDFATRMDAPDAGKNFDDFIYRISGSDEDFLVKMSKAFARSLFPDQVFVDMMKDERGGARLLGYSALRIRYKNVPDFKFDSSKKQRDDQLSLIEQFLVAHPEKR